MHFGCHGCDTMEFRVGLWVLTDYAQWSLGTPAPRDNTRKMSGRMSVIEIIDIYDRCQATTGVAGTLFVENESFRLPKASWVLVFIGVSQKLSQAQIINVSQGLQHVHCLCPMVFNGHVLKGWEDLGVGLWRWVKVWQPTKIGHMCVMILWC